MINLRDFEQELAALLQIKTGIFATAEKSLSKGHPAYIVSADEESCVLTDGGKQVERILKVEISCYIPKEQVGEGHLMVHKLYGLLFPYFRVCRRNFAPTSCGVRKENGFLKLWIDFFFCDTFDRQTEQLDMMDTIKIKF